MITLTPEQHATLATNSWYNELPLAIQQLLLAHCREKHLHAGAVVHHKGDAPDGLYVLLEGRLRISNVSPQGAEMVLTWLEPGSWFGEISLFDHLPRTHNNVAESDVHLLRIPQHSFEQLLEQEPALYAHFARLLCQRVRLLFSLMDDAGSLSLMGRLALRLCMLTTNLGQRDPHAGLPHTLSLSQDDLAAMLNASRQAVNQRLRELQRRELISLHYGKIVVHDTDGLQQLAC
ncbi:Crp/Fnr family transcriptional regulator [Aestuariibacter halophilus]|uniref:Crp/Fnr family transcriptional regulator n=1 Tax=Fluctibacter halophilus TaxID=226011 RepID=A0ABS8G892_9ALTE|nr:Crp/Fnr family transcriptional regulator [Aestuariibacter halophilus]MCC2616765.1 Crp/Fnr family transcriptional regulator [Aestuariibacter halophilus]